jgi:hypothetical protein
MLVAAATEDHRTPVVVELFTSEGCSSCPPADLLLARLEKAQPVPHADIIVLEEHVDYWDQQGWRDPFSSHFFTLRQQGYASAFAEEDIYTPQMVVDGHVGFSGGNATRALREISAAASLPHASVSVRRKDDSTVTLSADRFPAGIKNAEIVLAVTEYGLSSKVLRGENTGRQLSHTAVARSLTSVARFDPRKSPTYSANVSLHLQPEWNRQNLRVIAFVQDHSSHRIFGAATVQP